LIHSNAYYIAMYNIIRINIGPILGFGTGPQFLPARPCSVATFNLIISIGGNRGFALVDNSSTVTFMDYTFASKTNCSIATTCSKPIRVVGGGQLESCVTVTITPYCIQNETFSNSFKLLQLTSHDIILGCD
jgi:hypothetical protein